MRVVTALLLAAIVALTGYIGWCLWTSNDRPRAATIRATASPPGQSIAASSSQSQERRNLPTIPPAPAHAAPKTVRRPVEFDAPAGPYVDAIERLRQRANSGDRDAAYALSRVLLDCYYVGKGQPSGYGSQEPGRCNGLVIDSPIEAMKWLAFAADHGVVEAQVLYADAIGDLLSPQDMIRDPQQVLDYKARSMAYLNSALAQGSSEALAQLANAYYHGVLTDKNLETAYAYYYALGMVDPGADDPADIYGGGLNSAQIARAHALAEEIYHRCCN